MSGGVPAKYSPWKKNAVARTIRKRIEAMDQRHLGYLQPLLQTMIQLKNRDRGRGVFAFTGPRSGVGVSYVVQLVAKALVTENRCRVLVTSSHVLEGATDEDFRRAPRGCIERAPNVFSLVDDSHVDYLPEVLLDRIWIDLTPQDFDFVLIDCPPLNEAGDALRIGQETDGIFLVVGAGDTKRDQIEHAQRMLRHSSDRLQGIILNRRTYHVPEFLYKFL